MKLLYITKKGFIYLILSQLNLQKWRWNKLEEKDDIGYYSKDKELYYNVLDMINKVTKENGSYNETKGYTYWEYGLEFISKDYEK
jgi:hypothetical protein